MKTFSSLKEFWRTKNIVTYSLWPLAVLYRLGILIRRWLYASGIKKITRFQIPVVVVGNITVGGTGKTPLVIWLANFFKQQGLKPGIVSRGYMPYKAAYKKRHYPVQVETSSFADEVGDEAVLIARRTGCPMVVDPDRVSAVRALLQREICDVVISDDGLQHTALGRAVEIVVVDAEQHFGNGFCLPAGPLREPVERLTTVDFMVTTHKAHFTHSSEHANTATQQPQMLKDEEHKQAEFAMHLVPQHFYPLTSPAAQQPLDYFKNKRVHAVAGIGYPQRFFDTLRQLGVVSIEHAFPDHHVFQPSDFNYPDALMILMTEKDAVKCEKFADERFWCLSIRADMAESFGQDLLKCIGACS